MTAETTTGEAARGGELIRQINRAIPVFIWISPVLAGLLSLHMGKSMAWDLLHYHYYNGYAFLNDRLGFDILPAVFHTFLNPVLDVAFYAAVEALPARVVGFGLGQSMASTSSCCSCAPAACWIAGAGTGAAAEQARRPTCCRRFWRSAGSAPPRPWGRWDRGTMT